MRRSIGERRQERTDMRDVSNADSAEAESKVDVMVYQ